MRRTVLILILVAVGAVSCDDHGGGEVAAVVRDSAGVRIVENVRPALDGGTAWQLTETPLLQIGGLSDDPNYELFRVIGATRVRNGGIVVANAGTFELRFYDDAGVFLRGVGQRGGGPGEFQALAWVQPYRGDSLVTFDLRQRRITVFDSEGNLGRMATLDPAGGVRFAFAGGTFADGSIFVSSPLFLGPSATGGVVQDDEAVLRYNPDGGFIDSLAAFPGMERFVQHLAGGRVRTSGLPFGKSTSYAVGSDHFYAGSSEVFEIAAVDTAGHLDQVLRWRMALRPVGQSDLDALVALRLERADGDAERAELESMYQAMPRAEYAPAFASLTVDRLGNLWVEEYRMPGQDARRFSIFGPGGAWITTIGFPPGLRLREAGADYVIGVWRDELDVEYLQVYGLLKP